MSVPLKGVHRVRIKGREYVYAWRGGPRLDPDDLVGSYARVMADRKARRAGNTVAALMERFEESGDHRGRRDAWRRECESLHRRIVEVFGDQSVGIFDERGARGVVKAWRDQHAAESLTRADKLVHELSVFLEWAIDEGLIEKNPTRGVKGVYETDRSEIIWTDGEIAAVLAHLTPEAGRVVRFAAETGLAMTDALRLSWSAVGRFDIQTRRQKTASAVTVPILPGLRALLDETPKVGPVVLTSSRGRPYTADGFKTVFGRAKRAAGVEKNFHDLRGTAATRFLASGLSYAETGRIFGWSERFVERIAKRYVARDALAKQLVERLSKNKTVKPAVKLPDGGHDHDR
ncbi:MAG: tyrosine-type recombinase/integrase [Pseudomonadota bacterium]